MRILLPTGTISAIAVAVLIITATPAAAGLDEATDWGKPVLADDFQREQLGEQWEVPIGECKIRDGKLAVTSTASFYLFYKDRLPRNMAIEFDGMIPDTAKACDLAGIVAANEFEPAIRHYQGAFGTSGNKYSGILRGKVRSEGDEIVKRTDLKIEPGKWHRVRVERQDEFVRLFVDGEKVLEYRDPLGFAHASHNRIGLYTYGAGTQFDNIKIYATDISEAYKTDEAKKWQAVYDQFNDFCVRNFGAEKEPLIYEKVGRELKFIDDGAWKRVSETSACIGWETNLPARSYIEFGETTEYGRRTAGEERPFFLHIHYLRGLEPGKTYHYRLVSVDERGNRIVSDDATVTPHRIQGAIRLDANAEPPYTLDKAGATYVLTEDIVADSTALVIAAPDITLDLDGHIITYNEKHGAAETLPSTTNIRKRFHGFTGAPGVIAQRGSDGLKLYNGSVVQGSAGSGNGSDPLWALRATEIAGVTVDYYGYQMNGFVWAGKIEELHHNVVIDRGTELVDRHWAVRAISGADNVHHNLVKRCRQRGISGGTTIRHNEIYIDSFATNSLGVSGQEVEGNRIFGGGTHICAIAWSPGMQVRKNIVHLHAERSKTVRWSEYGTGGNSSCNGIRLTQYGSGNTADSNPLHENNLYDDNLVVITTREGGGARGVQFSSHLNTRNLVCKDSTIKVVSLDKNGGGACVVTQGRNADNAQPLYYRNCELIADLVHVKFGDGYSRGSNHRFENCTFTRHGDREGYHTFVFGRGWTNRHVLLDCTFAKGTRYDDVDWGTGNDGRAWYAIAWTATIKTTSNAAVTITDAKGEQVFSGKAHTDGKLTVPLTQCIIRPAEWDPDADEQPPVKRRYEHIKDARTPHKITVSVDDKTTTRTVTVDKTQTVEIGL
jgi:hypothetical protein